MDFPLSPIKPVFEPLTLSTFKTVLFALNGFHGNFTDEATISSVLRDGMSTRRVNQTKVESSGGNRTRLFFKTIF